MTKSKFSPRLAKGVDQVAFQTALVKYLKTSTAPNNPDLRKFLKPDLAKKEYLDLLPDIRAGLAHWVEPEILP